MQNAVLTLFLTLALALAPRPGPASPAFSALCDAAAEDAASETGIPAAILQAIGRVESGRSTGGRLTPWPWTVNHRGEGHYFPDLEEARAFAEERIAAGDLSMDIGCFQLNVKWHAGRFSSLDQMFDPMTNARAAADFLSELHQETGGWEAAVGLYHSRTEGLAEGYRGKVADQLAALGDQADSEGPLPQAEDPRPVRVQYPLLKGGAAGGAGSLVPLLAPARPLIGG